MSKILCYDLYGRELKYFYQWDFNQSIIIRGAIPCLASEVHFGNQENGEAIVAEPMVVDDCLQVKIPDILLQQDLPIFIYLYQTTENRGKTVYEARIPVRARARPCDYVYTNN